MIKDLFSSILEGDEKAFEKFYRLTSQKIFAYIWRLCEDYEMAQELTIQTYMEVWKSAKNFRGDSSILTWLYSIARHLVYKALKKRDSEMISEGEIFFHSLNNPLKEAQRFEIQELLVKALSFLPLKHREVLDLVFFHDFTYEEVSQILNIPVNTVKTRVFYAKKRLREILRELGIKKDDVL